MADNESGAHTDVDLLAVELRLNQLLCLLRNGLQSLNEERCDTWDKLHNGTHCNAEEEHLLDVKLCCPTDEHTYDYTQYERFAEHAKLLLHALSIDVELREARNAVESLVEDDGERHEALAERLRNRYAVEVVMLLELLGCKVGTYQSVDVADDGCEVAPQQALAHHKVNNGTDECKMPVVPKVDIDSTCGLGDEHEEVYAKTDGDDERTDSGVVSHSGSSRPTHVKHVELQMIDFGDALERIVEVGGEQ